MVLVASLGRNSGELSTLGPSWKWLRAVCGRELSLTLLLYALLGILGPRLVSAVKSLNAESHKALAQCVLFCFLLIAWPRGSKRMLGEVIRPSSGTKSRWPKPKERLARLCR